MPETTNDPDNDFALFSSEVVNLGSPDSMLDKKHGGTGESHQHERKNPEKEPSDEDLTAEEYARQDIGAKEHRSERLHENERDKQPMYWKLMYDATFRSLSAHETTLLRESGLPVPETVFEIQDRLRALDDVLDTRKNEILSVIQDKKAEIDEKSFEDKLKIAVAIESTRLIQSCIYEPNGVEKARNLLRTIGFSLPEFHAFYEKNGAELAKEEPMNDSITRSGGLQVEIDRLALLKEKDVDRIIDTHFGDLLESKAKELAGVNNRIRFAEIAQFTVLSDRFRDILESHAGMNYRGAPDRNMTPGNTNGDYSLSRAEVAKLRSTVADEAAGAYVDLSYKDWVPGKMEFRGPEMEQVMKELAYETKLALDHARTAGEIHKYYSSDWYARCADSPSLVESPYYSGFRSGGYVSSVDAPRAGTGFYYQYGLGKSAEDAATGDERFKPSTNSRSPMRMNPVRG